MKDLTIGDSVFGATEQEVFEVVRHVGGGNFGTVFEVHDEHGTRFALKTISTPGLDEEKFRALINEGNWATEVQHRNVIRVLFFHDGEQYPELPPYMITEYADAGTLEDFLDELRKSNTFLTSDELRAIFLPLAEGMKAINEKLVHRDIKPDNILRLGNDWKIADFGLSKVIGAATRTQTFKGINHIKYCAPEAWKLEDNLPSMDMYSMGVTFYEIATLRNPYNVAQRGNPIAAWQTAHLFEKPVDPRTLNVNLDRSLAQLILKMLSKRPADRYSSWDEVNERLMTKQAPELIKRDVGELVEQALATHHKSEEAKFERDREIARHKERVDFLHYAFDEIIEAVQETITTFNVSSEFVKLAHEPVHMGDSFAFIVRAMGAGRDTGHVECVVTLPSVSAEIDGMTIKGWGLAKAPSGRGFNLLLVSKGTDDLYGKWLTLHVHHGFQTQRGGDMRRSPFPFDIRELPEEIKHLNSIHVYRSEQGEFRTEMLDPLLKELVS